MAVAFESRICSKRNAPTGTMPDKECNRRSQNETPCPARRGATPVRPSGAGALTVEANAAPYDFQSDSITFHYGSAKEGKSRTGIELIKMNNHQEHKVHEGRGIDSVSSCTSCPRWLT